ncbi:hypothetical protein [Bacillus sp. 1P06AnD]|uniref:hypothetical protein n=1 Tax=Bacillus sp. 1P06AnD TaxID=3132208 RepID=UPI0039A3CB9E
MAYILLYGTIILILLAVYRIVFKKRRKKLGVLYTPFDDITSGRNTQTSNRNLDEDTKHSHTYLERL